MSADKLVDSTQLDSDLTSVANAIRAKSGGSSQLAFPAGFVSEIQAIPSGGGGLTPPVNAVAQFELTANITAVPSKILLDITGLKSYMVDGNRTYDFSLILWRNDVVSATTYSQITNTIVLTGRLATNSASANYAIVRYSTSSSASSNVGGNGDSILNSQSFSGNTYTMTMKNTSKEFTGAFKGIFTMLSPWTTEYTGTKITSCPSGFLTIQ